MTHTPGVTYDPAFEMATPEQIRLFNAAPEMLEALERIEMWTRDHPNGTCEAVNEKARSVLVNILPQEKIHD